MLETKKTYIYSALEKYRKSNEKLYMIHKDRIPKAQTIMKFLKFSSEEALRAFKIPDRFQMIHYVQRIIDKEVSFQKVKSKIKELQKEIKDVYALLKPLNEKGLPYLWDEDNALSKKDEYDNLIMLKRNNNSQFENLEGTLEGDVVVQKLGDVFDLFNLVRHVKFPSPLIEEYGIILVLLSYISMVLVIDINHLCNLTCYNFLIQIYFMRDFSFYLISTYGDKKLSVQKII